MLDRRPVEAAIEGGSGVGGHGARVVIRDRCSEDVSVTLGPVYGPAVRERTDGSAARGCGPSDRPGRVVRATEYYSSGDGSFDRVRSDPRSSGAIASASA